MGLHQRHTHGRVFHGEDAREQLKIRRRDSHGNNIRFHVPDGYRPQNKQSEDDGSEEVASVVYVTLAQTFDGPAVYSTMTGDYYPEVTEAPRTTAANGEPNFYVGTAEPDARKTRTADQEDAVETSVAVPKSDIKYAHKTTLATAAATGGAHVIAGTPLQATHSPSATAATAQPQDAGMSGGAKAGLAIAIILAIGLCCGLVMFCWRRKKSGGGQVETLNEKHGSFADVGARRAEADGSPVGTASRVAANAVPVAVAGAAIANKRDSSMTEKSSLRSTPNVSTAPRLSLRHVNQNFALSLNSPNDERGSANKGSDPFADAVVLSEKQARAESPPSNPFDEKRRSNESANSAGAAGAPWEGNEPVTPRGAQLGTAAAVPLAAGAVGGPPRQQNNVHRVQLDFKPSMDDELELVSGGLVRLLHEYDDGWALCISMDRSKQGVAPRTCLSKLPVKPRPQGPPQQHNGPPRGPPPPNGARRPSHPPGPNGSPGAMQPYPLTPQTMRNPRPNEQMPVDTRMGGSVSTSPPGNRVPIRKPVPGQAM